MEVRRCELCPSEAAVFCPSDAAFLCWSCDANIHQANFLVARHVRQSICSTCDDVCISSCSSSTISSSSSRRRRPGVNYLKLEGIFVSWCSKLGVEAEVAVPMACKVCLDHAAAAANGLPFRLCLAASMWLAFKLSLDKSVLTKSKVVYLLKRLQQISGVPAKLILAAVSKFRGTKNHNSQLIHDHLQEGWAES